MSPTLWIITPHSRLAALPWALACELGLVGLQRLTKAQWDDAMALLPIYV